MKKALIRNTFWGVAELGVTILLGFVLPPLFLRGFSMDEYGMFLTLTLFSTYGILTMMDFGMGGALTTFVARYHHTDKNMLHRLWSFAVSYFVIVSSLVVVVALFIIKHYDSSIIARLHSLDISQTVLVPTLVLVWISFLSYLSDSMLFGFNDYGYVKKITMLQGIVRVGIIAGVIFFSGSFESIIWWLAALALLRFGLLMRYLLREYRNFLVFCRFSMQEAGQWIKYSLIMLTSSLTGFVFNSLNRIIISVALPVAAMAQFDLASKPQAVVRGASSALISAILPASAHYHVANNMDKLKEMFVRGSAWLHMILLPPLTFIMVMMSDFIMLWLGPNHLNLVPYAQCIIVYIFFNMAAGLANTMLVGMGLAAKNIPIQVGAATLNVVLTLLLLKQFGLWAIVIAYSFSYMAGSIGYLVVMARQLEFSTLIMMREIIFPWIKLLCVPLLCVPLINMLSAESNITMFIIKFVLCMLVSYGTYYGMIDERERSLVKHMWGELRAKLQNGSV